jgi:hypothetical protein
MLVLPVLFAFISWEQAFPGLIMGPQVYVLILVKWEGFLMK